MIRLLSTDFDGTLVNHFEKPPVVPALFELFGALQKQGVLWALNTGRDLKLAISGLAEFGFEIRPDFLLTCERHVFRPVANGWEDYGDWNRLCEEAHDELFRQSGPILEEIIRFVETETAAKMIYEDDAPIGMVTSSEQEMETIARFIESIRAESPAFNYQRNTLYLRFCHADYSKGTALAELGRLTGVPREEIFAAGDHYNDVPMLDGLHARFVTCPGNSAEAVKQVVAEAGGYVAEGFCSEGVVEALRHFGADPGQ